MGNSKLPLLGVLILGVLAIGSILFMGKSYVSNPINSYQVSKQKTRLPSSNRPNSLGKVSFGTYVNKESGYSLKYPDDWIDHEGFKFDKKHNQLALLTPEMASYLKTGPGYDAHAGLIVSYYDSIKDLNAYDKSASAQSLADYLKNVKDNKDAYEIIDFSLVKVGNYDAYLARLTGPSNQIGYFFEKNGHIYLLYFSDPSGVRDVASAFEAHAMLEGVDKLIRDSFTLL